jgi:hypothetical protein
MVDEEQEKQIPNLQIDAKNRIMEQTLKVPLIVNGENIFITIRKLNTGIRNKIRSECTKTTIVGGQPNVKIDELEIQEKILAQAIIEAPFDFTVEGIKKLPVEVGDYLFGEYSKFAEPSQKKNIESEKA